MFSFRLNSELVQLAVHSMTTASEIRGYCKWFFFILEECKISYTKSLKISISAVDPDLFSVKSVPRFFLCDLGFKI